MAEDYSIGSFYWLQKKSGIEEHYMDDPLES